MQELSFAKMSVVNIGQHSLLILLYVHLLNILPSDVFLHEDAFFVNPELFVLRLCMPCCVSTLSTSPCLGHGAFFRQPTLRSFHLKACTMCFVDTCTMAILLYSTGRSQKSRICSKKQRPSCGQEHVSECLSSGQFSTIVKSRNHLGKSTGASSLASRTHTVKALGFFDQRVLRHKAPP